MGYPIEVRVVRLRPVVLTVLGVVQGEKGEDGGGSTRYRHTQASAAAAWVINHNLGYWPTAVSVRSPGGVEVEAQITHNSVNQLTVNFAGPYAGTVDIL